MWVRQLSSPLQLQLQLPSQRSRKPNGLFSTPPPRVSAQNQPQKSETSAYPMDSVTIASPFPFFKLPGELRNKVYRLVVVTGRDLIIQDMHLQEFKESQEKGTFQSRSTYLATDHVCGRETWPESHHSRAVDPCLFKDIRFGPMKTTYILGTPSSIDTMTLAMLSLNKESRNEVAFIFYGENTFHFTTMSLLVAFMKDRTAETRIYIQRVCLTLTVDNRDWDAIFTEYGRPATWNTAFSSLVKLPHVNIKKLCVQVDDTNAQIFLDGLNLRSRSMLWLHKLSKLEDLEMLGLRYIERWTTRLQQTKFWELSVPMDEGIDSATEQELWRFLAPKMLKKKADDHSPDALQRRRIWDFSHTGKSCRTPIIHETTGH